MDQDSVPTESDFHQGDVLSSALSSGLGIPVPGDQVGDWVLQQQIGEGGYGIVFLASSRDRSADRQAAIKMLKPGIDTIQVQRRFEREQLLLSELEHPFIAQVLELVATRKGQPCIVMEYVEGDPITDYCDQRKATIEERVDLLLDTCDALVYSHAKGVMHRDIKPENVLVERDEGRVKLIDFGIARLMQNDQTMITMASRPIGTPGWMAPEQWEGESDARTDVFSMGTLACKLIFGVRPSAPTMLGGQGVGAWRAALAAFRPKASLQEMKASSPVEYAELAELRSMRGADLDRAAGQALGWIVRKCLQTDQGDRYQSIESLAEDLRRWRMGLRVSNAVPGLLDRGIAVIDRRRGWFIGLVLALVLSGLVGIGATYFAIVERELREQATEQSEVNLVLGRVVVNTMAEVAEPGARELDPIDLLRLSLDRALVGLSDVHEEILIKALADLGKQFVRIQQYRRAFVFLEAAKVQLDRHPGVDHDLGIEVRLNLGLALAGMDEAVRAYLLLEQVLDDLANSNMSVESVIQARLGIVIASTFDHHWEELGITQESQLGFLSDTLELAESNLGPLHQLTISAKTALARYYERGVDPIHALELARLLEQDFMQLYGVDSSEHCAWQIKIAFLEMQIGNESYMIDVYDRRGEFFNSILGNTHPAVLNLVFNVAVLKAQSHPKEALQMLGEAWEGARLTLGPLQPLARWYADFYLEQLIIQGHFDVAKEEVKRRIRDLEFADESGRTFTMQEFFSCPEVQGRIQDHPAIIDELSVLERLNEDE